MCPPYTLTVSGDFCIRSPEWKLLYTLFIRICVDARIRIFLYTMTSQIQNQSLCARYSKMAASNVVCSLLLEIISSLIACLELNVAMLNLNFDYLRRHLSIVRLLAISDSTIRRQRLLKQMCYLCFFSVFLLLEAYLWCFFKGKFSLFTLRMLCWIILRDIRIQIGYVYVKCGRRYFCIRIKKVLDTKISGYVWTGP